MRGVRLSSNGLSSSGRCGVGVDSGTSDPQEPQEPMNLSAAFCYYLYPSSERSEADAFFVGG